MTISEMTTKEKLGALYATMDCRNRPCDNCVMNDTCRTTCIDEEYKRKLIREIQKELREKEQTNDQEN